MPKRVAGAAAKDDRKVGRAVMLDALHALSDRLLDGSADLRAIGLEQILRTLKRPLPHPDLPDPFEWKGYGP